jgi:tetratricopeptide (TPR) repeat protein
MKQIRSILLSSLVCLVLLPQVAAAKGTTKHRAPAASGGGVMMQTPNPQTALEHNNRGVELGSKGLWPDAIKEHEIALAMAPGNKDFRTNLSSAQLHYGNVLFRSGKYYEAIKQFRGALFVDPDNLPADEGLDECFKRLGKNPVDSNLRRLIAEDLDGKGMYEDAIVEYRKVVKMEDSGKSHADLGYVLMKADKPVDGYSELRIAVQKPWKNDQIIELSQCHRKLAEVLLDYAYKARDRGDGTKGMRRLINAVTEYKRAVTLNPADAEAIRGFTESVRECCALRPTFDNELMLGGAYLLGHDFNHAKMAYELCYKVDPRRTELQQARLAYHKGVATWPTSSDELVMESLGKVQKFLETDPDNAKWWYILGRLKQHLRDNDGAMEAYRHSEKINPLCDPDLEMQIKVLGGAPESPYVAQQAGGGQPAAGGPPQSGSQAIASAGGGNGGNPSSGSGSGSGQAPQAPARPAVDTRSLQAYSQVEQMMGSNPSAALDIVNKLLEKNPSDGHAWLLKGDLLRKMGQLDDAAAALRMADGFKEPDAEDALNTVNTVRIQDNMKQADQFIQAQDWTRAVDQLQDAIIKAPDMPATHRKLAEVLRHMSDDKGAEREERKAKDLEAKKK